MAAEIKTTLGRFKGNPTIGLQWGDGDEYPFTFGLEKARKIVAGIEAIKRFVAQNEPQPPDRFDMGVEDEMARRVAA